MGNMCSKPQPLEPVPAPRSGEPGVSQELAQLRSQIDMVRSNVKTGNEKMNAAEKKLAAIRKFMDGNREVILRLTEGVKPIDQEISEQLPTNDQAESQIVSQRRPEIEALSEVAQKFSDQEPAASQLHAEVKTVKKGAKKALQTLDELAAKAASFAEELAQIKDLKTSATSFREQMVDLKRKCDNAKTTATAQAGEMRPMTEKIQRWLSSNEDVIYEEEEGGNMEVIEEQEVAAEVLTDFTIDDLFIEEQYSRWLSDNSVLKKAFEKFNTGGFGQADLKTVVETFERVLREKDEENAKDEKQLVRPLDLDLFFLSSLLQPGDPRVFCEFMSGLLAYSGSAPYANVISRILGIHESASTAPSFAATVPAALAKLEQSFDTARISKEVKTKIIEENKGAEGVDYRTGADIRLNVAVNAIFEQYATQPVLAWNWAKYLRPESTDEDHYLLYLLCNRIKAINSDSNKVFKMLTKARTIEIRDFTEGLKREFNMHLSEDDAQILFNRIDTKGTGTVSRLSFVSEVKLQWYLDLSNSQDFLINKAKLLEGYLRFGLDYMKTLVWETYLTSKSYQSRDLEFHTAEFPAISAAFDEPEPDGVLEKIQEAGQCVGSDVFGFDEMARYALRRPFGQLSKMAMWSPVSWTEGELPDPLRALLEEITAA